MNGHNHSIKGRRFMPIPKKMENNVVSSVCLRCNALVHGLCQGTTSGRCDNMGDYSPMKFGHI